MDLYSALSWSHL